MNAEDPTVAATSSDTTPSAKSEDGFTFTDPGCRTEIRIGALLILAAVFMWLWLGPAVSMKLYLIGAPLLAIGVPIQALQARRFGRPGFPWKLGLVLFIGGAAMWPDLRYRESIGGELHWQPVAPLLFAAGAWILAWWPIARRPAELRLQSARTPTQAQP